MGVVEQKIEELLEEIYPRGKISKSKPNYPNL